MKNQKGFTLIELVMVIVLLGILAAVAIPRYLDLSTSAKTAALDGIEGAVKSSAAILIASYKAPQSRATVISNVEVGTSTSLSAGGANIIVITDTNAGTRNVTMGSLTSD